MVYSLGIGIYIGIKSLCRNKVVWVLKFGEVEDPSSTKSLPQPGVQAPALPSLSSKQLNRLERTEYIITIILYKKKAVSVISTNFGNENSCCFYY